MLQMLQMQYIWAIANLGMQTSTKPAHNGLSVQGRSMIREMNRIGMYGTICKRPFIFVILH